jgi:oligopeptide transport system substrate-binding protein
MSRNSSTVQSASVQSAAVDSKFRPRSQSATFLQVLLAGAVAVALAMTGCTKKRFDENDNSLNLVLRANVKGLDPASANDLYSSTVITQMYEGLLAYNYLKRPFTLQAALAESMPEISKDGLTYTFKIKKGVKFHDNPAFPDGKGREVTAQDFVYSWKRLADPRNTSEGFWIFDGKIKGLNEWASAVKNEKANYETPVEGLQTPDSHTLVIKLNGVYHQLAYVLAMPFSAVVPREAVEKYGKEFLNNPVGTGPFVLEKPSDWVRNSKITLKKNPNYRPDFYPTEGMPGDAEKGLLADAGKQLPLVDKLVFSEIVEDQPRWQNGLKGNFDWVEIPKDNFDNAVAKDDRTKIVPDLAAKGLALDITPALDVTYIGFNMVDPVLGKNKLLRQAMSKAFDSNTYIQKFLNGRGIAAQGPVPPGIDSYEDAFKNPNSAFNIEEAKALLTKAGFPEGKGLPEFQYEGLSDSTARQGAEFFVQAMAAIGIKVKINSNTWPQFQEKIKAQKAQIFGIAWGADYPDAQNFFQLFYSKNKTPGPNDTSFNSPEFDKAYEAALKLPPGTERTKLYHKMRDIVADESPWIFNAHRLGYKLVHGWVGNFKWTEVANDYPKYIRIDAKKRAELGNRL